MPSPPPDPKGAELVLAPVVFTLLVLATLGAFAYAQERKGEPLILDRVVFGYPNSPVRNAFTPNEDGCVDRGRIRFRITKSDRGDVQVITPSEQLVRTLASDRDLPSYTFFEFNWDGRDGSGRRAPGGPYKLRVLLRKGDRSLIPRGRLRLHTVPGRSSCRRAGRGERP